MIRRITFDRAGPEHVRRRLEQIEADDRCRRAVLWRAIGALLGLTLLGLTGMALGLMSSSPTWGPALFWLGVLVANLGFAATLAWAYLRLER